MKTVRRKHSHNKIRTTIKALLHKTRYTNKKNKHHKTKKIYHKGGGPKVRAKGESGVPVEAKVSRGLVRQGLVHSSVPGIQAAYQKKNPRAEFDIPIEVSGLEYNISVKTVKRKTSGQNTFTIMCGDARRFMREAGIGKVPYRMIIGIREKHPTDPTKKKIIGLEIDLRNFRQDLFGTLDDCEITKIVDKSNQLTQAYCEDPERNKPRVDAFNEELRTMGARMQLAPKKGNPEKCRDSRMQSSFGFHPFGQDARHVKPFSLSSIENSSEIDEAGLAQEQLPVNEVMSFGKAVKASRNSTASRASRASRAASRAPRASSAASRKSSASKRSSSAIRVSDLNKDVYSFPRGIRKKSLPPIAELPRIAE